jgi:hypothetical protein
MNVDYFVSANFRIEENKEVTYFVKFKNFVDGLCIFGGFLNSIMSIGMVIIFPFNYLNYKKELINRIFDFEEDHI